MERLHPQTGARDTRSTRCDQSLRQGQYTFNLSLSAYYCAPAAEQAARQAQLDAMRELAARISVGTVVERRFKGKEWWEA